MLNKSKILSFAFAALSTATHAATSTKTFSAPLFYDTTGNTAVEITLTQTGIDNPAWETNEYRITETGMAPFQELSIHFYTGQAANVLDVSIEAEMRIFDVKTGETIQEGAFMTDAYNFRTSVGGSYGNPPQGQIRFSNPTIETTSNSQSERSCDWNEKCISLPTQISGSATFKAIPGHYLDVSQVPGCATFSCMQQMTDRLQSVYGRVSFIIGAPVPEPSTIALAFSGIFAAFAIAAKRRKTEVV